MRGGGAWEPSSDRVSEEQDWLRHVAVKLVWLWAQPTI